MAGPEQRGRRFELLDVVDGAQQVEFQPGPRRRTRWWAAAAVVGVLLVAVVRMGAGDPQPPPHPPVRPESEWQYQIGLRLPAGWAVDSRGIEPGSQYATVTAPGSGGRPGRPCLVEVSPLDRSDLSRSLVDPQRVEIGERPGFVGAFHQAPGSPLKENERVVWEYGETRWATVLCDTSHPVRDAITVARSVRMQPTPLTLPFTIGPLPRALAPRELTHQARADGPDRIILELVAADSDQSAEAVPAIARVVLAPAPVQPVVDRQRIAQDFGGHPAWFEPDAHSLTIGEGAYVLTITGARLSRAELIELAAALRLPPDLVAESTWSDAPDVFG